MMSNYLNRARKKHNEFRCYLIRKNPQNIFFNENKAYITIFHDYESDYAGNGISEPSHKGVTRILDIESEYGIKATYNIVGKLMNDVPNIIYRIIDDKHEIGCHSFDHSIQTNLSKNNMRANIDKTKQIYNSFGLKMRGFRSPQSKWNFDLMSVLLQQKILWSAEVDRANYPYIIKRETDASLVRVPITYDDWIYQVSNITPNNFYRNLVNLVDRVDNNQKYMAIGFHPWVQGLDNKRLLFFENFIKYLTKKNNIKIVTFGEVSQKLLKQRK